MSHRAAYGFVHIEPDPVVAADVRIDTEHPLRVFVPTEDDKYSAGVTVMNTTARVRHRRADGWTLQHQFQWSVICNWADEILKNGHVSHYVDVRIEELHAPLPRPASGLESK